MVVPLIGREPWTVIYCLAEDREELKALLAEDPFDLNLGAADLPAPDKIKIRVTIAQVLDAWLAASSRISEKTKVEAEQRAAGVPLSLPQGDHVEVKLAFEAKYRA